MKTFLYYFDKWTEWLDFSWLLMTKTRIKRENKHDEDKHDEKKPLI